MKVLLLSNSTNYGETYMSHAKDKVAGFLGDKKKLLFIPYAGVTISYNDYTSRVQDALGGHGIEVEGIHTSESPVKAIQEADAIAVGGGNTFRLLEQLYANDLIDAIVEKVKQGCPYVGWSAGSNVAGLSICTTNDMPIVEPPSFVALGLVPFQINPHYTDATIANHGGESRKARLEEFVALNTTDVVCLPEGTWIEVQGSEIDYDGGEFFTIYQHPNKIEQIAKTSASNYFERFKKFTSN